MHVKPVPHDLDLLASDIPRSPGLHMSQIYGDLYSDLEPKRFRRDVPLDPNRVRAGLDWERIMENGLKASMASRPGEFITPEGIIFSPDLLIYPDDVPARLGEIKLTWMSSRDVPRTPGANGFPPKFDKWFVQMKAYCHALATPYARLYTLFVNGDYTAMSPELLAWDLEFSSIELKENMLMLLNHARHKKLL